MPWWTFEIGGDYALGEVLAEIAAYIDSGKTTNPEHKRALLALIEASAAPRLRYDPAGDGRSADRWGKSPMNPRVWVRPDGERLVVPAGYP